jgi:hypothetical protein
MGAKLNFKTHLRNKFFIFGAHLASKFVNSANMTKKKLLGEKSKRYQKCRNSLDLKSVE